MLFFFKNQKSSRNTILSGAYAEHTGLQVYKKRRSNLIVWFIYDQFYFVFSKHDVILPEQPIGLPTSFKLMPQHFKDNGYKTHMIGK
jgi:arylsulfatase A-like enzyme